MSRYAGQELAKALGQPIVVENKPGAGGTIAMAELARAPADGYTIAFASQGTLVFNQAIFAKPGYDSAKVNAEVNKIFASAEAKEKLGPQGFDLAPPMTPVQFGRIVADDLAKWVPIVKASGAKAD